MLEFLCNAVSMKTPIRSILALLVVAMVVIWPNARAVVPPPNGGYPNFTTAEGQNALKNLTTGAGNTAVGWFSLFSDTTGAFNTGVGAGTLVLNTADNNTATGTAALFLNTTGFNNTAVGSIAMLNNDAGGNNTGVGAGALTSNTTGNANTAVGVGALGGNTSGGGNTATGTLTLNSNNGALNTATGLAALQNNTTGGNNTGMGAGALNSNTTGGSNTASGASALMNNSAGGANTASGVNALLSNTAGNFNTAVGFNALNINSTGNNNIALGFSAGSNIMGDNNIDIGSTGGGGESSTIRIGTSGSQTRAFISGINGVPVTGTGVSVAADGQLGVAPSSRRFKDDIKPMNNASEALLALKPITFRYKKEIDRAGVEQFGLVAEEVEKVNPDLVVHDKEGKPYSVRYDQVNAMLLNEFLKEHRTVEELKKEIAALKTSFQKLSTQIDLGAPPLQTVVNNTNNLANVLRGGRRANNR